MTVASSFVGEKAAVEVRGKARAARVIWLRLTTAWPDAPRRLPS
jgi:hypothetical protein